MKKSIFILAMLLSAATAFTQTSRRSANNTTPAKEQRAKSKQENKTSITTTRRSSQSTSSSTPARSQASSSTTRTTTVQTQTRQQSNNTQPATNSRRGTTSSHYNNQATRPHDNNSNSNQSIRHNRSDNHTVGASATHHNTGTTYVTTYESPRVYRGTRVVRYHYTTAPRDRYYRASHFPYRTPVHIDMYWTPAMRLEYARYYPMVSTWRYTDGYRIPTVSAYDAIDYQGEVMNVYGKVYEVFYTGKTDEYVLYFGAYYPYHDMSVVLPGWIARRLSRWPEQYFERQDVVVTGLIAGYEDKPEIVIRNTGQIRIY